MFSRLSTNNDPTAATVGYSIVTGHVSTLSVLPAPSTPGVKSASYSFSFVATHGITAGGRSTRACDNNIGAKRDRLVRYLHEWNHGQHRPE